MIIKGVFFAWGLTLNVDEQVGAHEGEDDHRYWQRTVWHHLPDFSMQEWAGKKLKITKCKPWVIWKPVSATK